MGILLSLFLVQGLIDRLGSDRIEDREQAEADLEALGMEAIPELERASESSDPEVASRARRLALLIPYRRILTPAVRKVLPRIGEGILRGEKPRWGEVFQALEAAPLDPAELARIVVPALRDALPRDKTWICQTARQHDCRPPLGELLPALAGMDLFQIASLESWLRLLDVPEATGGLAEALGSPDPGVRRAARLVVAGRRERDAIPTLTRALASPDAEARREAVVLIRDLDLREHASDLLPCLSDPDAGVREEAAGTVCRFGMREAIRDLVRLLQDPASRVRVQALRSLAEVGSREQAGAVAERLRDPQAGVRNEALSTLGRWGARERADEIACLLTDPVYWVREGAWDVLKALGAPGAVPRIRSLLAHPAPGVREGAVGLLSDLAGADALPWVAGLLRDPDRGVRFRAVQVVGRFGARAYLPELTPLVDDPDPGIVVATLRAIRFVGFTLEPSGLARLFRTPHSEVRRLASESLVAAGAREETAGLLDLLESEDPRVRSDVLALAQDLHLEEALEKVIRRLDDSSAEVRALAARTLQHLGSMEAVPPLLWAVEHDPSGAVQRAAAESLGRLGAREAALPLLERVDGDFVEAVEALGRLGATEAWSRLVDLMEAGSSYSRPFAVGAVARVSGREAVEALESLLGDGEPCVRLEAARHLTRLGGREAATVLAWGADETRVVGLFALNAVRAPKTWSRLSTLKAGRCGGGTWKARLEALAREAGVTVEWDGVDPADSGLKETRCPRTHSKGGSVVDALEEMIDAVGFEAVLEEGRIRILPIEDALLLFRLWDESR